MVVSWNLVYTSAIIWHDTLTCGCRSFVSAGWPSALCDAAFYHQMAWHIKLWISHQRFSLCSKLHINLLHNGTVPPNDAVFDFLLWNAIWTPLSSSSGFALLPGSTPTFQFVYFPLRKYNLLQFQSTAILFLTEPERSFMKGMVHLYPHPPLKKFSCCLEFLFGFGKAYDQNLWNYDHHSYPFYLGRLCSL